MFGLGRLLTWLMLPDVKQEQEQRYQQVVYPYDPRILQREVEPDPEPEEEESFVEWDTFVPYGRSNSVMFRLLSGQQYIDELEECYRQMFEELRVVRLFGGVEKLLKEYDQMRIERDEKSSKLQIIQAQLDYQKGQTDLALELSSKTDKINGVLEDNGYERKEGAPEPVREGNKFASADGRGKPEKQRIAVAMKACGYSNAEISKATGIGVNSVPAYISGMKDKFQIYRQYDCRWITFDDKLGHETWNLDEKFGKAEEAETPLSSSGIVKHLKNPVMAG